MRNPLASHLISVRLSVCLALRWFCYTIQDRIPLSGLSLKWGAHGVLEIVFESCPSRGSAPDRGLGRLSFSFRPVWLTHVSNELWEKEHCCAYLARYPHPISKPEPVEWNCESTLWKLAVLQGTATRSNGYISPAAPTRYKQQKYSLHALKSILQRE